MRLLGLLLIVLLCIFCTVGITYGKKNYKLQLSEKKGLHVQVTDLHNNVDSKDNNSDQ